jgi:hypothetical protein
MRTRARLAVASSIAVCIFAFAVNTANANRFEISNQNWRGVYENFTIQWEVIRIRCPLTLEGSFHSKVISKIVNSLVGYVTRAIFQAPCEETTVTALNATLPWHEIYESFSGTLPQIRTFNTQIVGFQYLISLFGGSCLYGSPMTRPAFQTMAIESTLISSNIRGASVRLSGGITCPEEGRTTWSGSGGLTVLGTTTPITVRLVQ